MNWGNHFYEVIKPYYHFRIVGWAESNTYFGNSMIPTTVFEGREAQPGEQIHALHGGLFSVVDGNAFNISRTIPKHPFEKNYGPLYGNAHYLDLAVELGEMRKLDSGAQLANYRNQPPEKQFPKYHGPLVKSDASSEFELMKTSFGDLMLLAEKSEGYRVNLQDVYEERDVFLSIREAKDASQLLYFKLFDASRTDLLLIGEVLEAQTGLSAKIANAFKDSVVDHTPGRLTLRRDFRQDAWRLEEHFIEAISNFEPKAVISPKLK